jgi:type IV pilus assembly protein PilA
MLKKGFTLLEVMIVVIIIGVLAAIALPNYITALEKGRSGEAATNVGAIRTAIDRYWYQNAAFPADLNSLDIDNPNSQTNALYSYTIANNGTTASTRAYTVTATRTVGSTPYTLTWKQDSNTSAKLLRSANLGGPTS